MLYEFRGYDGQIELYENKIVIRRKGTARVTRGFSMGDKEIYLSAIQGIQVKKPGLNEGYIQFLVTGSQEVKGKGLKKAKRDENTVMFAPMGQAFTGDQAYQEALELKRRIEMLKMKNNGTSQGETRDSAADQLLKYKALLDSGAITQEKFAEKKAELLEVPRQRVDSWEKPSARKRNMEKKEVRPGCIAGIVVLLLVIVAEVIFLSVNGDNREGKQQGAQEKTVTLADVQQWYEDRSDSVEKSLKRYAEEKYGVDDVEVLQDEFHFGEEDGWIDCHYTIQFSCTLEGEPCVGEARAFRKYKKKTIHWFHFEIFKDGVSYIEEDEEYDKYDRIIEKYYGELKTKYPE